MLSSHLAVLVLSAVPLALAPLCAVPAAAKRSDKPPARAKPSVLMDSAHQYAFFAAWDVAPLIEEQGFRVIGSQAALDTVLVPDGNCRVRLGTGDKRPFGWRKNPHLDAIVTYQSDPSSQDYLPEEIAAVKRFVRAGGGLVMIGGGVPTADEAKRWPLNRLAAAFGAAITDRAATVEGAKVPVLALSDAWQPKLTGDDGSPASATRAFGKGRVAIVSSLDMLSWRSDGKGKTRDDVGKFLKDLMGWVSERSPRLGAKDSFPEPADSSIYPELKVKIGDIDVLYARNQKPDLLKIVKTAMPAVKKQIESWLPSVPPKDPTCLLLCSGDGGGWAVNDFTPHEVATISLDPEGVLSVFAHELAHTMAGPPNDKGEVAGQLPELFSEAHAGWFQGKIEALRRGKRDGHDPNNLFGFDKDGKSYDIAKAREDDFGSGWTKLWWIFQKLDDRCGPTWYPRWLWVKSMRWRDNPSRQLSWDDVVEDMSIAVGEDLFPFFRSIGTTLGKDRFPSATFAGKAIQLPPAQIPITKAGDARLDPIGDYKLPLSR